MRRAASIAVAVAVCLAAVAVGQERPVDQRAVLEALLERSRLLEDVRFCVPQDLWKQYLREKLGGPALAGPPAPVPWIAEAGVYRLTVTGPGKGVLDASVRIRVFDLADSRNIPVLSAAKAWNKLTLTVDGDEAKLVELPATDRFLRFTPSAASVFILTARTDVEGESVALDILPSVMTRFEFEAPAGLEGRLEGRPDVVAAVAGKATRGFLPVAPCGRLVMSYGPPPVAYERSPRYQVEGTVAWSLDADVQHVSADLAAEVLVGRSDRIELSLPEGAERVEITGPEVRQVQGGTVFLKGLMRGQVRLKVEFDLPYRGAAPRTLAGLGLREGRWVGGTLAIAGAGGDDEIVPDRADGLTERTLVDLPASARALLRGQPVAAYRISGGQWTATVEALRLGQFAMRESIADLAHYQVALQADGAVMGKAQYEIRNRSQQFLRVRLPAGAVVMLAQVNEKAQPMVALPEAPGVFVVPLVRSDATVKGLVTFPVEIVYLHRAGALGRAGTARVPLPQLDIPIAYAWGEAYLPEAMRIERWAGPMQQVLRYSSETAAATLAYGSGELAAGYKAAERIHADSGEGGRGGDAEKKTGDSGKRGSAAAPAPRVAEASPKGKPGPGSVGHEREPNRTTMEFFAKTAREKGTPFGPASQPAGKDAYAYNLGRNYWRTGQEQYQAGNYVSAARSLRNVVELAPRSQEAENARRLLANIDVVQNKATLTGKGEKALGKGVQAQAQEQRQEIAQRQAEQLERGFQALREGKKELAQRQFQGAEALNRALVSQGEAAAEQDVLLRRARQEMNAIAAAKQQEAQALLEKARSVQAAGDVDKAMELAKSAREVARSNLFGVSGKEEQSIASTVEGANKMLEDLTIAANRKADQPATGKLYAGGFGSVQGSGLSGVAPGRQGGPDGGWSYNAASGAWGRGKAGATSMSAAGIAGAFVTTEGLNDGTGPGRRRAVPGAKESPDGNAPEEEAASVRDEKALEAYRKQVLDYYAPMGRREAGGGAGGQPARPSEGIVLRDRPAPGAAGLAAAQPARPPDGLTEVQTKVASLTAELDRTRQEVAQAKVSLAARGDESGREAGLTGLVTLQQREETLREAIRREHSSLATLRRAPGPRDASPGPQAVSGEARTEALRQKLRTTNVRMEFEGQELSFVLDYLRETLDVPLLVKWRALEAAEVQKRTQVTIKLKNVTAEKALQVLLGDLSGTDERWKLAYGIGGGAIVVSTREDLGGRAARRVYDVPEAQRAAPSFVGPRIDVSRLGQNQQGQASEGERTARRTYDVRDMLVTVPNFVGARIDAAKLGQNRQMEEGIFGEGTNLAEGQGAEGRHEAIDKVIKTITGTVAPSSWADAGGDGRIEVVNGQLVIEQTPENLEKVRKVLSDLREARGARVQEGERLAGQNAGDANDNGAADLQDFGLLKDNFGSSSGAERRERDRNGDGRVDLQDFGALRGNQGITADGQFLDDLSADFLADNNGDGAAGLQDFGLLRGNEGAAGEAARQLHQFVEQNYDWATNGRAANGPVINRLFANRPAQPDQAGGSEPGAPNVARPRYTPRELVERLRTNRGQKTNITSWNLKVDRAGAAGVGVRFREGNNKLGWAVVDEAQLRTLAELEAGNRAAAEVTRNPRRQDTIIGTDALLANGMTANAGFAADRGNVLDVMDNPIAMSHEKYLLIDNGGFLTAVRSLPMENWQRRAELVEVIEAPQQIDVPRVGRAVRFEKKLIQPNDTLELDVTYEWKGAR